MQKKKPPLRGRFRPRPKPVSPAAGATPQATPTDIAPPPPPAPPKRPFRPLTGDGGPDILYGAHTALAALGNPRRRIRRILLTRNGAERFAEALQAAPGIEPEVVGPDDLDRLTGPEAVHQGIVVLADPLSQPRLDKVGREGVMVLLDQVTDPHNVGAILRSCAAFAVTALVATARHSPEGSGVLWKSASGAAETVPFVKVTNLARAMDELKDYGFTLVGLDSEAEGSLDDIAAALPPGPVALVLGAEGKGLRKLTRDTCDRVARLALPGSLQSLNVSNAAAVALYALTRARRP
jgi:23S rRNA (guanosine2251-2'-O)-methyltransferase